MAKAKRNGGVLIPNKYLLSCVSMAAITLLMQAHDAHAETMKTLVDGGKLTGYLRSYYFTRHLKDPVLPDQSAFSLGGKLNLQTKSIAGFSADIGFYAADPLGLNDSDPVKVDNSLPGYTVNTLGQAYLQYQNRGLLLRLGNQEINTPWANAADSRMIPALFQGASGIYSPLPGLKLGALRMFRFKNRTSGSFDRSTLITPPVFASNGFLALSGVYDQKPLSGQLWYYKFYDLAQLGYAEASYRIGNGSGLTPMFSFQYAKESGAGQQILGPVDSQGYGAKLDLIFTSGNVALAYNHIPVHNGKYNGGDFLSPYVTPYAFDPLYTTSMTAGLVDKGSPGNAWKLSGSYFMLNKKLRFLGSYAAYHLQDAVNGQGKLVAGSNSYETDLDATYFLSGALKGLSLRERLGIVNSVASPYQLLYNRVMLQYDF